MNKKFQPSGSYNHQINDLKRHLQSIQNPERAKILARFFKTGKGEYEEGDRFIGISVPQQRKVAKKYMHLSLKDLQELLSSKTHEYRLTALIILVEQYKKANEYKQKKIFDFYISHMAYINNWDLVDLSAPKIIGEYLKDKNRSILYKLAKSKTIWERRIAILATYTFIRKDDFKDTLRLAKLLIDDDHDLIHKAIGWMLREVGKRNLEKEVKFLDKYAKRMPRTMLRYAIEQFPKSEKRIYMKH